MPDVRMPDGTIIKNVPQGTTKAQLMAKLQQQQQQQQSFSVDNAIDNSYFDPTQEIVNAYKKDVVRPRATNDMSGGERFLAGIGRGMVQLPRGIGQLLGAYSQAEIDQFKKQDADLMATPQGGLGDFTGQMATGLALPVKAPMINNPIVNLAVVGGAYGAVMPVASDESRVSNAVVGSVAGTVLPPMIQKTTQAATKLANKIVPSVVNKASTLANTAKTKVGGMMDDAVAKYPVLGTQITPKASPNIEDERILQPNAMPNPQNPDAIAMAQEGAQKLGLNWADLGDDIQRQMAATADEAMRLSPNELTPEMIAKKALLEAQGFIPTRADITGNPQDYAARNSIMMQPEGAYLHDVARRNNDNLEKQILSIGGDTQALPKPEFGAKLRSELEGDYNISANRVSNLYKTAAEKEGGIPTNADDLSKALNDELAFAVSKQDSPVREFLRRIGKEKMFFPTENTLAAKNIDKNLTMKELATLRQIVNSRWENADNATQNSLNNLRGILNQMEANPSAPAPIYREARVSRIVQGEKWEQPALERIFAQDKGKKGQYIVADEDLLKKTFFDTSNKDFLDVWRRMNSSQKDLTRSQIAKSIRDDVFSNMQMTSGTNAKVIGSPAKLIRTLEGIGDFKLKAIFGEQQAKKIKMLGESWREIRSSPEGTRSYGSAPELARMYRMLTNALKIANFIPVVNRVSSRMTGAVERAGKASAEEAQRINIANNDQDIFFAGRQKTLSEILAALNRQNAEKAKRGAKAATIGTFSVLNNQESRKEMERQNKSPN
jgi:hypothetical protein